MVEMHMDLPPLDARKCDVLPALQQTLLSFGQLCDVEFKATLDSETAHLTKDGIATPLRKRDHRNGLCFILLQRYPTSTHSSLPTTGNSVLSAITKFFHSSLHTYVFANRAY